MIEKCIVLAGEEMLEQWEVHWLELVIRIQDNAKKTVFIPLRKLTEISA